MYYSRRHIKNRKKKLMSCVYNECQRKLFVCPKWNHFVLKIFIVFENAF